jgi:predicted small lipoprotein YifL
MALLAAAAVVLATGLSGCGQRGPLYLPGKPAAPVVPARPDPVPIDSNSNSSTSK